MSVFDRAKIDAMEKRFRAAFINSLSGFKSANLIGTADKEGHPNLAIVSSVIHLGSDPPLFGLVMRPPVVPRHTYENMRSTGIFTVSHVHADITEQAHQTSARYPRELDEFQAVGFTPEWRDGFKAPFPKEARIVLGLKLEREVPIEENGTRFMIGSLQWVDVPDDALAEDGYVDIGHAGTVAISGLDAYHRTSAMSRYSYAKVGKPIQKLDPIKGFSTR